MTDQQDTLPDKKKYQTTLILDWKNGSFKTMKRPPKHFKPSEIPIDFSCTVQIPKQIRLKASADITLSESKVAEIVAEEL